MFCSRGISHRYEFLELQPDKANKLTEIAVFSFFNHKFGNKTGQYKTWTADCGLGIKYGLGIKCRLRTEYKTRTRYKTRATDYDDFKKVKLREMESGLAKQ